MGNIMDDSINNTTKFLICDTLSDMLVDNIASDLVTMVCHKLGMEESTRDPRYIEILSFVKNNLMDKQIEVCEDERVKYGT